MSASERRITALEDEVARLRHLLKSQMTTGEELEFEAIVRRDGTPLVNLRWDTLAAQVSPDDARRMAYNLLRVCEWADCDSTLLKAALTAFDGDEQMAGGLMAIMREARGGHRDQAAVG